MSLLFCSLGKALNCSEGDKSNISLGLFENQNPYFDSDLWKSFLRCFNTKYYGDFSGYKEFTVYIKNVNKVICSSSKAMFLDKADEKIFIDDLFVPFTSNPVPQAFFLFVGITEPELLPTIYSQINVSFPEKTFVRTKLALEAMHALNLTADFNDESSVLKAYNFGLNPSTYETFKNYEMIGQKLATLTNIGFFEFTILVNIFKDLKSPVIGLNVVKQMYSRFTNMLFDDIFASEILSNIVVPIRFLQSSTNLRLLVNFAEKSYSDFNSKDLDFILSSEPFILLYTFRDGLPKSEDVDFSKYKKSMIHLQIAGFSVYPELSSKTFLSSFKHFAMFAADDVVLDNTFEGLRIEGGNFEETSVFVMNLIDSYLEKNSSDMQQPVSVILRRLSYSMETIYAVNSRIEEFSFEDILSNLYRAKYPVLVLPYVYISKISGHAMLLELSATKKDFISFKIFNTGDGVQYHASMFSDNNKEKIVPFVEFKDIPLDVFLKSVFANTYKNMFKDFSANLPFEMNSRIIYEGYFEEFQSYRVWMNNFQIANAPLVTPQMSGSCSVKVLIAYVLSEFFTLKKEGFTLEMILTEFNKFIQSSYNIGINQLLASKSDGYEESSIQIMDYISSKLASKYFHKVKNEKVGGEEKAESLLESVKKLKEMIHTCKIKAPKLVESDQKEELKIAPNPVGISPNTFLRVTKPKETLNINFEQLSEIVLNPLEIFKVSDELPPAQSIDEEKQPDTLPCLKPLYSEISSFSEALERMKRVTEHLEMNPALNVGIKVSLLQNLFWNLPLPESTEMNLFTISDINSEVSIQKMVELSLKLFQSFANFSASKGHYTAKRMLSAAKVVIWIYYWTSQLDQKLDTKLNLSKFRPSLANLFSVCRMSETRDEHLVKNKIELFNKNKPEVFELQKLDLKNDRSLVDPYLNDLAEMQKEELRQRTFKKNENYIINELWLDAKEDLLPKTFHYVRNSSIVLENILLQDKVRIPTKIIESDYELKYDLTTFSTARYGPPLLRSSLGNIDIDGAQQNPSVKSEYFYNYQWDILIADSISWETAVSHFTNNIDLLIQKKNFQILYYLFPKADPTSNSSDFYLTIDKVSEALKSKILLQDDDFIEEDPQEMAYSYIYSLLLKIRMFNVGSTEFKALKDAISNVITQSKSTELKRLLYHVFVVFYEKRLKEKDYLTVVQIWFEIIRLNRLKIFKPRKNTHFYAPDSHLKVISENAYHNLILHFHCKTTESLQFPFLVKDGKYYDFFTGYSRGSLDDKLFDFTRITALSFVNVDSIFDLKMSDDSIYIELNSGEKLFVKQTKAEYSHMQPKLHEILLFQKNEIWKKASFELVHEFLPPLPSDPDSFEYWISSKKQLSITKKYPYTGEFARVTIEVGKTKFEKENEKFLWKTFLHFDLPPNWMSKNNLVILSNDEKTQLRFMKYSFENAPLVLEKEKVSDLFLLNANTKFNLMNDLDDMSYIMEFLMFSQESNVDFVLTPIKSTLNFGDQSCKNVAALTRIDVVQETFLDGSKRKMIRGKDNYEHFLLAHHLLASKKYEAALQSLNLVSLEQMLGDKELRIATWILLQHYLTGDHFPEAAAIRYYTWIILNRNFHTYSYNVNYESKKRAKIKMNDETNWIEFWSFDDIQLIVKDKTIFKSILVMNIVDSYFQKSNMVKSKFLMHSTGENFSNVSLLEEYLFLHKLCLNESVVACGRMQQIMNLGSFFNVGRSYVSLVESDLSKSTVSETSWLLKIDLFSYQKDRAIYLYWVLLRAESYYNKISVVEKVCDNRELFFTNADPSIYLTLSSVCEAFTEKIGENTIRLMNAALLSKNQTFNIPQFTLSSTKWSSESINLEANWSSKESNEVNMEQFDNLFEPETEDASFESEYLRMMNDDYNTAFFKFTKTKKEKTISDSNGILNKNAKFFDIKNMKNISDAVQSVKLRVENTRTYLKESVDYCQHIESSIYGLKILYFDSPITQFYELRKGFVTEKLNSYNFILPKGNKCDLKLLNNIISNYHSELSDYEFLQRLLHVDRGVADREIKKRSKVAEISKRPSYLVFESSTGFTLYRKQLQDLGHCIPSSENKNQPLSFVLQRPMSFGKTFVLGTLMAVTPFTPGYVTCIIPPSSLFESNALEMLNRAMNIFGRKGRIIKFDRTNFHLKKEVLYNILNMLTIALEQEEFLMTPPETVQSIENRYLELLLYHSEYDEQIEILKMILNFFRAKVIAVFDEIDMTFHPYTEFNYPTKEKTPADHVMVNLITETLRATCKHMDILGNRNIKGIPEKGKILQTVVLDDLFEYLDKNQDIVQKSLNIINFGKIKDSLKSFILGGSEPKEIKKSCVYNASSSSCVRWYLLRQLFVSWLPEWLSTVPNMQYGFSKKRPEFPIIIPYLSANFPNEKAEVAEKYDVVTRTTIYLLIYGISKIQMHEILSFHQGKLKKAKGEEKPSEEVNFLKGIVPNYETTTLFHSLVESARHSFNESLLSGNQFALNLLFGYVERLFSSFSFYTSQIVNNALFASKSFYKVRGYTGTLYNPFILPQEIIDSKSVFFDQGANGKFIYQVLKKSSIVEFDDSFHYKMTLNDILKDIFKNQSNLKALIDVGAVFKEFSNFSVAKAMLELIQSSHPNTVWAVLYFDESINKLFFVSSSHPHGVMLSNVDHATILKETGVQPEHVFTFFDQRHCTGTNIMQLPDATALITVGLSTNLRDFLQGVLRMRKFMQGQIVNISIPKSVADFIRSMSFVLKYKKILETTPDSPVSKQTLFRFLNEQGFNQIQKENEILAFRKIKAEARNKAMEEILMQPSVQEAKQKASLYRDLFVRKLEYPIELWRSKIEFVPAIDVLRKYCQNLSKVYTEKLCNDEILTKIAAKLPKEIPSINSPDLHSITSENVQEQVSQQQLQTVTEFIVDSPASKGYNYEYKPWRVTNAQESEYSNGNRVFHSINDILTNSRIVEFSNALFDSRIYMTNDFIYTLADNFKLYIPNLFDEYMKKIHHILFVRMADDSVFSVILSIKDALELRESEIYCRECDGFLYTVEGVLLERSKTIVSAAEIPVSTINVLLAQINFLGGYIHNIEHYFFEEFQSWIKIEFTCGTKWNLFMRVILDQQDKDQFYQSQLYLFYKDCEVASKALISTATSMKDGVDLFLSQLDLLEFESLTNVAISKLIHEFNNFYTILNYRARLLPYLDKLTKAYSKTDSNDEFINKTIVHVVLQSDCENPAIINIFEALISKPNLVKPRELNYIKDECSELKVLSQTRFNDKNDINFWLLPSEKRLSAFIMFCKKYNENWRNNLEGYFASLDLPFEKIISELNSNSECYTLELKTLLAENYRKFDAVKSVPVLTEFLEKYIKNEKELCSKICSKIDKYLTFTMKIAYVVLDCERNNDILSELEWNDIKKFYLKKQLD